MTEAMEGVVAQLRDVRDRLAATAMIAMRAKADADQGHRHYVEVSRGTDHSRMKQAVDAIGIASAKSARIARILDEARQHFGRYLNIVAPGTVPADDTPSRAEMPSGEQLIQESTERADARKSMDSFLSRMARNVGNLQDAGKNAGEVAQNSINVIRNPSGPAGSQSTGTTTPVTAQPTTPARIETPDAVGHLIVFGLIAGVTIHRSGQLIRQEIARFKAREHETRAQRPDPGDGSTGLGND